jgi:hypothetical protein
MRGGLTSNVCVPRPTREPFDAHRRAEPRVPVRRDEDGRRRGRRGGHVLALHALVRALVAPRASSPDSLTSRCVEALTRAGEHDPALLRRAVAMFEVRCVVVAGWIHPHFFSIGLPPVSQPRRSLHGRDFGRRRGVSTLWLSVLLLLILLQGLETTFRALGELRTYSLNENAIADIRSPQPCHAHFRRVQPLAHARDA